MLSPGSRLGAYEIVSLLGAGGMGEVYRARDTALGRDVALKLLFPSMAGDAERVARFQREAQILASLNHPHIAAIYGLEQHGTARVLVLELVEEGTLAGRLASGPLPVDEALHAGRKIAIALQAAHDKGVVHRDLKPSNIAFTASGEPKVLDFGLAKLGPDARPDPASSLSPTITSPALMTGAGVILGTAAYMAPEQAKGRPADRRSDIWGFGCVLYEMLTGRRAFEGEDVADTLANVLKAEPDWSRLPPATPTAIRVLLRRCLAKDPRQRDGDISAAIVLLEEADTLQAVMPQPAPSRRSVMSGAWIAGLALFAGAIIAGGMLTWMRTPATPRVVRTAIPLAGSAAVRTAGNDRSVAITPDGRQIAYVVDGGREVLVRTEDALQPRSLVTLPSVRGIFASPDGQSVGIIEAPNRLGRIPIDGGALVPIALLDEVSRGATWLEADTIVFATVRGETGLQSVSAKGGAITVLTRPDAAAGELDHFWPQALPGGKEVLFTILSASAASGNQIAVLDLASLTYKVVMSRATAGRYLESGHLLYRFGEDWYAVAVDPDTWKVTSTALPIPDLGPQIAMDVSRSGTLVHLRGVAAPGREPVKVDASGRETPLNAPRRGYQVPDVSRDGRIVFHEATVAGGSDVFVLDPRRGTIEQVTSDPGRDSEPIWSPDSQRIAYFSTSQPDGPGIFIRPADGTGKPERLTRGTHLPTYWSARGNWVGYVDFGSNPISSTTAAAQMAVDVVGDRTPRVLRRGGAAAVAPTERWLATVESVSDTFEIYVRPLPDSASRRFRVSNAGGLDPVWSMDGQTLYYRSGRQVFAVDASAPDPSTWEPKPLFEGPYAFQVGPTQYAAAPDGTLIMLKLSTEEEGEAQLIMVQNFHEELRRLLPR
jgi:hypothetical protein